MRLDRVLIENFRGVRRAEITLDEITVFIAEDGHGKASILDALGLCLGSRGWTGEARLRREDFHFDASGCAEPVRIVLTFSEGNGARSDSERADSESDAPVARRIALFADPESRQIRRSFVDATLNPLPTQPSSEELARVQRQHPVLLLRFARPRVHAKVLPPDTAGSDRRSSGRLTDTIAQVYHDLADPREPVAAERIERGLSAAQKLLEGHGEPITSRGAPVQGILEELRDEVRRWERSSDEESGAPMTGSGSHNLALLLVLGALLEVYGEDELAAGGTPIIAIEEPEAHLHPILLASTWDVIEALSAQTVVTTNSGDLLSSVPMTYLRRLVIDDRGAAVHRLDPDSLSARELRRVAYHIRAKRGGVLFARCWMLVEGESEFWLMNQLAEVMGYDLDAEGVRIIEFAQCGVAPLAKVANDLGLGWHLLADGDDAGSIYARGARGLLAGEPEEERISRLGFPDVEQCLWHHGFDDVYRAAARMSPRPDGEEPRPPRIIGKAVRKRSKPYLALAVAEAVEERGHASIPPVLRSAIEHSVRLARVGTTGGRAGK